jgi:quinol monooxygenase YgiN
MAAMLIQHQVKDYTLWRKVFDSANDLRASNGELASQIYRDANNPNRVTVLNTWDTLAHAQKFAHSPELKAAMEKAGVEGPPNIYFLNES